MQFERTKTSIMPDADIDTPFIKWYGNTLLIRKYYCWDGPSGVTLDTKTFMRGSLVHDALYQLMREGRLDIKWRDYADKLLRDICIADGMWRFRANYVYWAVSKFGAKHAQPRKKTSNVVTL